MHANYSSNHTYFNAIVICLNYHFFLLISLKTEGASHVSHVSVPCQKQGMDLAQD